MNSQVTLFCGHAKTDMTSFSKSIEKVFNYKCVTYSNVLKIKKYMCMYSLFDSTGVFKFEMFCTTNLKIQIKVEMY